MTEYYNECTNVGISTLEKILPIQGKVWLRLSQKDSSKGIIIFNFFDVYYLPHSFYNLISLDYHNSHNIYYDNENKMLYHIKTRKILTNAKQ